MITQGHRCIAAAGIAASIVIAQHDHTQLSGSEEFKAAVPQDDDVERDAGRRKHLEHSPG